MIAYTSHSSVIYADWTLIVFTVFAQFAVGASVFSAISEHFGEEKPALCLNKIAFALMAVAGIVSLLHLQNPFNALYTLTQVGHSWLSREILAVGMFSGLLFLQLFIPQKFLRVLASLLGMILVYVISQVYNSVDAMPFWANMGTMVGFYGTALLLGGAIGLCFNKETEKSCLRCLAVAMIILGITLSLASKLAWIGVFMRGNSVAVPELFTPSLCYLGLQTLLIILGLVLILPQKNRSSWALLSLGTLCLLAAELAGRTVFFMAQLKIGV